MVSLLNVANLIRTTTELQRDVVRTTPSDGCDIIMIATKLRRVTYRFRVNLLVLETSSILNMPWAIYSAEH